MSMLAWKVETKPGHWWAYVVAKSASQALETLELEGLVEGEGHFIIRRFTHDEVQSVTVCEWNGLYGSGPESLDEKNGGRDDDTDDDRATQSVQGAAPTMRGVNDRICPEAEIR